MAVEQLQNARLQTSDKALESITIASFRLDRIVCTPRFPSFALRLLQPG